MLIAGPVFAQIKIPTLPANPTEEQRQDFIHQLFAIISRLQEELAARLAERASQPIVKLPVTVDSPNGGESFAIGDYLTVHWSVGSGVSSDYLVDIDAIGPTTFNVQINRATAGKGSMFIPESAIWGPGDGREVQPGKYKIKISLYDNSACYSGYPCESTVPGTRILGEDLSDDYFEITK